MLPAAACRARNGAPAWAPDGGRRFALPDSVLARAPSRYRARLAPERATWGVLAATGFGFVGTGRVALGDPLGERRVALAADLLGRPLDETNALLVCSYLPRRWDLGAGLFHFRDYHSSRHETGAEALGSARIFAERSWGALLEASYPFDRSRRLDLDLSQVFVERTLYEEDEYGSVAVAGRRRESLTSPAVSLVGDNTLWGGTGPVGGGRYHLTFSPSFAWLEHGLAYRSVTLDARQYWGLTGGYVLAGRVLACRSDGRDAPDFQVGGFGTLRGFPLYGLAGTRALVVNAELRFPFVERLGVVGPVPLGGLAPMLLMQLGEVVFGGVGSGLYGMLMFVIAAVFISGLMVGRTPEYLGKKIEAFEMKMASVVILIPPLTVKIGTAIAVSGDAGRAGVLNPGAHGFSEILYAFSSAANNNGSAFAGLTASTPFYDLALGLAMLVGRYGLMVPVLAMAGSLAAKKKLPAGLGTLPTHTPLFVTLVVATVLVVGALAFFPALALGPIVEHLMLAGAR